MHDITTAIGLMIAVAVLASASVHDIRSREVPDAHWMIIGTAGVMLSAIAAFDDVSVERLMVCAGSALILFDILHDREWSLRYDALFYAITAMMFLMPLITSSGDAFAIGHMAIPVCYIIFIASFYGGVIKGGADVKCMMVISIMFPVYPDISSFPIIGVPSSLTAATFVFPLAVLFHASLFSVLAMIPLIVRNIVRGDTKIPEMFTGYRMHADRVSGSHVWPMHSDGGIGDADGMLWVTPKIPFIVPVTAAVLFVAFIGNIIFLV
jgi:preflagellin peptidase FlaK